MIAVVVGEGGSGGAVALAAANRVLMFEHAVYSVISPEGCASILWRTADKAADAAEAMKITAPDLQALGVVDRIVPEPIGGAHRDPAAAIASLKEAVVEEIAKLQALGPGRTAGPASREIPRHRLGRQSFRNQVAFLPVHWGEIPPFERSEYASPDLPARRQRGRLDPASRSRPKSATSTRATSPRRSTSIPNWYANMAVRKSVRARPMWKASGGASRLIRV